MYVYCFTPILSRPLIRCKNEQHVYSSATKNMDFVQISVILSENGGLALGVHVYVESSFLRVKQMHQVT